MTNQEALSLSLPCKVRILTKEEYYGEAADEDTLVHFNFIEQAIPFIGREVELLEIYTEYRFSQYQSFSVTYRLPDGKVYGAPTFVFGMLRKADEIVGNRI